MIKFKKLCALALAVSVAAAMPALASDICADRCIPVPRKAPIKRVRIVTDGEDYSGKIYLTKNTMFVSLREFASIADSSTVSWDEETSTATVESPSLTLSVASNSGFIEANGRVLCCNAESFIKDGKLYVPVRQLSQAFGFTCDYSAEEMTTYLTRREEAVESGDQFYDPDELYWLSRIIEAEAGGEPFDGKLAVGSVILNRKLSDEFPDSIVDVIFDTANGVQFSPVANGAIYNEPSEDSIKAAKMTLEGYVVTGDALYFLNQRIAQSFWIVENCTYVMTIGNHDFFA